MIITQKIVTINEIAPVEKAVKEALNTGDGVIDCTQVESADSALLALILECLSDAQKAGVAPTVINLPEGMWSLAKLYGVRELIRPFCQKTSATQ